MKRELTDLMKQKVATELQTGTSSRAAHRGLRLMLAANLGVWLFMFVASSSAWGLTTSALKDQTCAGYRGGKMTCTAGEFTVSPVFSAAPGTPPFCVAGQAFSFQVDLGLSGTNADRYNVGFFVGQQGNDPTATTAGNICSVATFPTSPSPWANFDGDACGDFVARGNQTTTVNEIKVLCSADSIGALVIPHVVTYWQNTSSVCTGPADVTPGSTSKCNSGTSSVSGTVAVYSGAYVDVTKQSSPDGDGQPFSFTATGPAGSKVIALTDAALTPTTATGGTYTPATIAAATNTTTVTLTDGQTARFYINALASDQTLTITEAATTNWESTAAISCATVTGSPALTIDNANRSLSATLNTTNTAAACTVTNTKRSRITLNKSVTGRIDSTDQFTVSASGGGTLVGTASATTTGAGTTANTTFYSTPATALTLTDAKASGPTPLTNYETRLTCTNAFTGPGATANASLPNNLSTANTSITPAPGDDIACTYTNTPRATLTKAFSAGTIGVGQMATLTFSITNPAGAPVRTGGLTFTDSFPANLVIAGMPNVVNNCGGTPTITATAGGGTFTVGGTGVNAAAGASTCTISVDVTSSIPSSGYVNGSAQITAISGSLLNGVTNRTLTVSGPPSLLVVKSADRATVNPREVITYTVIITNSGGGDATSVTVDDRISPYTALGLNTYGAGEPFQFTDGTPATGLSLGVPLYSNDSGATWAYVPVSGGGGAPAGYDGNITNWKIPMTGIMNPAGANFTLTYKTWVK